MAPPSENTIIGGRYLLGEVFSQAGGMSVIYDATDLRTAQAVLVKVTRYDAGSVGKHFTYDVDAAATYVKRARTVLRWEAKMLARFANDGVDRVPLVLNLIEDRSIVLADSYQGRRGDYVLPDAVLAREPYLVMQRVHGTPLTSLLKEQSFIRRREAVLKRVAVQLLSLLIRLHRRVQLKAVEGYFIFQDLKPDNILVGPEDQVTLVDFGAVTLRLEDRTTDPSAGMITHGYAAPESEHDPTRIDQRFDLYSLGATLWHAATGRDPRDLSRNFPVLDRDALTHAGLSPAFTAWIAKALSTAPADRWMSAAAMRRSLIEEVR